MKHRVFIAINLPEEIKDKLVQYQQKWPHLPARWTKRENLHITLEFLGYLTDEEIIETCQRTEEIVSKKKSFLIFLDKICYAPPGKKIPRMIWATGKKIKEFNISPHITLARIRTWQFKQMEEEDKPEVDQEIDLSFEVNSIEIMESRLKKGGPEYTLLKSIPFSTK